MAKATTQYRCTACAHITGKWSGCCLSCSAWNTLIEEAVPTASNAKSVAPTSIAASVKSAPIKTLHEVQVPANQMRLRSNLSEWDQVVGGGLMPGSFVILTGDPGIGKSTLLLQVAAAIAKDHKVIYFSSEESLTQVKQRATRLNAALDKLYCSDVASLDTIVATALHEKPAVLIVDSIQNCYLSEQERTLPGGVAQLRHAGFLLMKLAKEQNITIIVTGHITKEGEMAGPKILEHLVDAVFYLQGEDHWHVRILRAVKNRFGTINELGFFEMTPHGMETIANINKHLLSQSTHAPGSALTCSMEGTRPLLLELQALCVPTKFAMPQRVITGVDPKRVLLIAAILEKYLHTKFSGVDIFFKVSSGCSIKESAADLGIALALLSSYFQQPPPAKSIAIGEISLTGQIKPVAMTARRLTEAAKFGLATCYLPYNQEKKGEDSAPAAAIATVAFKSVYELLRLFPTKE